MGSKGSKVASADKVASAETVGGAAGTEAAVRKANARKRSFATMLVIGAIVLVTFIAGQQAVKPQVAGESISQTFIQGEPCETVAIALSAPVGSDAAKTADLLFKVLKQTGSVNAATYNPAASTLEVGFCEEQTSENDIRQALAPTGLLAD